jgi:PIN domain nuclease of toxin-antitoxin system
LDSHVLIWAAKGELSTRALDLIFDEANQLWVSVAGLWEIAIKLGTGRIEVPPDLLTRLPEFQVAVLPITVEQAWAARSLPLHHRDPFDRMMVVQAMLEKMTLVTRDKQLKQYDCEVLLV